MTNRRAAEAFVLQLIHEIIPDGANKKLYEDFFASLNDRQFGEWIGKLKDRSEPLRVRVPNGSKVTLSTERNVRLAAKYKLELFKHCYLTDPSTKVTFKTPKKYLVGPLVFRRLAQTWVNKMSVAKNNLHVDQLTDQPTGVSRSSGISLPEGQMIHAQGLSNTLIELLKTRGGDRKQYNAANRLLFREGRVSQKTLNATPSRVKSTETLSVFLKAQHLNNNL